MAENYVRHEKIAIALSLLALRRPSSAVVPAY